MERKISLGNTNSAICLTIHGSGYTRAPQNPDYIFLFSYLYVLVGHTHTFLIKVSIAVFPINK